MPTILFTFHENVQESRREALLEQLRATKGVEAAGRVRPDASLPSMRRLGYAEIDALADGADVKRMLEAAPEVVLVPTSPRGVAG
jgi:hypothetical protein